MKLTAPQKMLMGNGAATMKSNSFGFYTKRDAVKHPFLFACHPL